MRTHIRAALTVLPLALTLMGCGGSDGSQKVASANGSAKDGATSSAPKLSRDEALLKFAQCLRDHGMDVDDPKPGEGIQMKNDNPANKAKNDQAVQVCSKDLPPEPAENGSERADMLKVAKCMRDNGVENFPDPKPGEGIGIDEKIGGDPDFDAAWKKCNEAVSGGTPDTHGDSAGSNG